MLMRKEEALRIVEDCELKGVSTANGYAGKEFVDVLPYCGPHGAGYTISGARKTEYWIYKKTRVSNEVYNGQYSVHDVVEITNQVKKIDYKGVPITPLWELQLDTLVDEHVFHRTEDYKPVTLCGRTLIMCWVGAIDEKTLRAKIRRKMREMVNSGRAELV